MVAVVVESALLVADAKGRIDAFIMDDGGGGSMIVFVIAGDGDDVEFVVEVVLLGVVLVVFLFATSTNGIVFKA